MKMNTLSLQQTEQQFIQDLNYEEYLRDINNEPTSQELDDMEKVFCKSKILKRSTLSPINTLTYQPLIGA